MVDSVTIHALFLLNVDGVIETWNPGAERLFGWVAEEIIGQPGELLWTAEDRAAGAHIAEMVGAATNGNAPDERWHVRRDGSRVFLSGVMTAVRADGKLVGYAKVARDATVRQMSIEALVESEDALRAQGDATQRALDTASEQNEALGELVAAHQSEVRRLADALAEAVLSEQRRISTILHDDLQQLIVGAMMRVQALRGRAPDPAAKGRPERKASTDIDSVLKVLNDAYEVTRTLTGRLIPPDVLSVPLGDAFVWLGHDLAEIHGLTVEVEVESTIESTAIVGHVRALVLQSTRELLFNVIKHSGTSEASVRVESTPDALVIVVEDAGAGLPPGEQREGYGIRNVRARLGLIGGTLVLGARPGGGTRAEMRLVVTPEPARAAVLAKNAR